MLIAPKCFCSNCIFYLAAFSLNKRFGSKKHLVQSARLNQQRNREKGEKWAYFIIILSVIIHYCFKVIRLKHTLIHEWP
jgi:hypothetical protein